MPNFIYFLVHIQSMAQIIIDDKIRHGKPILKGTRITVEEVLGMLESGMTYEEIKKEYGLTKDQILSVIRYASSFLSGELIHKVPS